MSVLEAPDKLDLTTETMYNFFLILHFLTFIAEHASF